ICRVPQYGLTPVVFNRPETGLEGKFSMEFVVASMLTFQQLNIDTFNDKKLNNETIRDLIPKIESVEDLSIKQNRAEGDIGYVSLDIITNNDTFKERVYFAKGTAESPLSEDEIRKKFHDCMRQSVSSEKERFLFNS